MVLPEKIGNTVYEPGYLERDPGVMPKGKIIYHEIATRRERNEILRHYFGQQISVLYKEPKGAMKFRILCLAAHIRIYGIGMLSLWPALCQKAACPMLKAL